MDVCAEYGYGFASCKVGRTYDVYSPGKYLSRNAAEEDSSPDSDDDKANNRSISGGADSQEVHDSTNYHGNEHREYEGRCKWYSD